MELQIAVAKIEKYAVGESGDTVEVVERPHGGYSAVLVDGQRSGESAKAISNLVARKAISLLAEGVRDGAAARAAHDYLRTHRRGKVSAEMIILSADLETGTLVISRNARVPVLVCDEGRWRLLDLPAEAVGIHARTRPQIEELLLRPGVIAIAASDGVWSAGERNPEANAGRAGLFGLVQTLSPELSAKDLADDILAHALLSEQSRPQDDLTVVAIRVGKKNGDDVRRLSMSLPIPSRIHGAWDR
jgi:serine phosphatase RsbU (regulator of sigma subunit)